jgi:hypothetical protein
MIVKLLTVATALLAMAGAAFAQSSDYNSPSVAPSSTPSTTPPATPTVRGSVVGGLSKCENMLGDEKDKCVQEERGGTASTGGRPAGAGGSHAPGSTGTGAGTMGPQDTAPSGSVR